MDSTSLENGWIGKERMGISVCIKHVPETAEGEIAIDSSACMHAFVPPVEKEEKILTGRLDQIAAKIVEILKPMRLI